MILRKGSAGPAVEELQGLLARHGFYAGAQDGDFGPKTEAAVRQFQASIGLKSDGVVGEATWRELRVSERSPQSKRDQEYLLGLVNWTIPTRAKAALNAAILDVGKRELPTGSNVGPEIEHLLKNPMPSGKGESYYDYIGYDGAGAPPWCALAVCAWVAKSGIFPFPRWFGGVSQLESWAGKAGLFRTNRSEVWPSGAIFTMGRAMSGSDPQTSIRNGHCGLVVMDEGDSIVTVEGNTDDSVAWRRRKKSTLRGYIPWWA